jgi:flagellar assembly protein FliH
MLAAGGECALPARVPAARGTARPADLRDTPLPPVIAERVAAVEREAHARGYAEGVKVGESAATARTDALHCRLSQTIDEIAGLRTGLIHRTEREIVRLALAIAARVMHREAAVDENLLLTMARVAIDRLGDHAAATIHLNPADLDALQKGAEPLPHGGAVKIVADHQVPKGGCLVRSAYGAIDASIDGQVREIARGLLADPSGDSASHDGPSAL